MKKPVFMFMAAMNAAGTMLYAQATTRPEPGSPSSAKAVAGATEPVVRGEDEKAIRALLDAFTKAFDAGDAEAAAATYSENGIVVDEQGERTEGRAGIRDQYARSFADNPGSTIRIQVDSLRILGPETAIEEGRTTIKPAEGAGPPDVSRFVAVYVKQDGRWRQAVVRDELARDLSPHDRLKELEWLVGDWVNESQESVVSTKCGWAVGGNFIDREFTMKSEGRPVLSGTQRIGWDPLRQQFKTWIFDSEGGHGEGYFTRISDEWVVKVEGVGRDGLPATSTNVITRLGKDRIGWQSVQRTLGGAAIPGLDEFVLARKPPEAGK